MFFKKGKGALGSVYGTKGAVDRKSLGTTDLHQFVLKGVKQHHFS
jgi:hypothetical protein